MNHRIAILASGNGSNAENIALYFSKNPGVDITLIASNNEEAFVLERARKLNIPTLVFSTREMNEMSFADQLRSKTDFVILAGFLLKIPQHILLAFPDRIINIHPALLPSYGGKGMYGDHVHKAVIEDNQKHSGITIHLVNENYDEGRILFQSRCQVYPGDTTESLASRIHQLEYDHYPRVIEDYIQSR